MTKPTEGYPDFAMSDVSNPNPNVVEPDISRKLYGWNYNEKPPRQYFNWLARVTSKWIKYFDDEVSIANDTTVPDLFWYSATNSPATWSMRYFTRGNGKIVTMRLPEVTISANPDDDYLQLGSIYQLPTEIRPGHGSPIGQVLAVVDSKLVNCYASVKNNVLVLQRQDGVSPGFGTNKVSKVYGAVLTYEIM